MKKMILTVITLAIIVIAGLIGIEKTTAGIRPLIDWATNNDETYYFVKTETDNYKELWNGNYRYTFSGYDSEGNQQKVVKVMDRTLRPEAYIKIYTNGSFGEGWVEVQEDEIPEEVLTLLNK